MAGGTEGLYQAQGKRFEFEARGSKLLFRSYSRPAFEADLATEGIDNNVPFLLTLLLITPGMSLRNRSFRLALGLLLLFAGQTLFVSTKVEASLIAAGHPLAGAAWFWHTVDNFFEITGKAFLPVAIWLVLGLPYMMGLIDRREPAPAKVGRNTPCPCGSGKKYKHCCGG